MLIQPRDVHAALTSQSRFGQSRLQGTAILLAAWAFGSSACGSRVEGESAPALETIAENATATDTAAAPDSATATVDFASRPATQTALDGATLPKFVEALPTFSGQRVDGTR